MTKPTDPAGSAAETLRALLETYLRCPVEPGRAELEQGLRAYQTEWIRAHAGTAAPVVKDPAKAGIPKPKFPIAASDLEVLKRMANGWTPTTADMPRWAWFENRELVMLEPNPAGGPEVMRLTDAGWTAVGLTPR